MTSPISSIAPIAPLGSVGSVGSVGSASAVSPTSATGDVSATGGSDFSGALGKGLDAIDSAQTNADNLAIQAATGQAIDPAAVTVAMTQAQLMTQLATTVQSKAVTAFNTIMGMQA